MSDTLFMTLLAGGIMLITAVMYEPTQYEYEVFLDGRSTGIKCVMGKGDSYCSDRANSYESFGCALRNLEVRVR